MLEVCLCHAPADRDIAVWLGQRLERCAEARVWREECGSALSPTLAEGWEAGLGRDAILLLLSPEAVPGTKGRPSWAALLEHLEPGTAPPVGCVLIRSCSYPAMLERKHFFRLDQGRLVTERALERWMVSLQPIPEGSPTYEPARLRWFEGRDRELETLWKELVDVPGVVRLEASQAAAALAQEFARQAQPHFRDIVWVRPGMCFPTADLAHRVLLVSEVPVPVPDLPPERLGSVLSLEPDWGEPTQNPPQDETDRRLWEAFSVCGGPAVPVQLAARIAGFSPSEAQASSLRLANGRWLDPFDAPGAWFRVVRRRSVPDDRLGQIHAQTVASKFRAGMADPGDESEWASEWEPALTWAVREDWNLATVLGTGVARFLESRGRIEGAARVYDTLLAAAGRWGDETIAGRCRRELSWLRGPDGDLRTGLAPGAQLSFGFE